MDIVSFKVCDHGAVVCHRRQRRAGRAALGSMATVYYEADGYGRGLINTRRCHIDYRYIEVLRCLLILLYCVSSRTELKQKINPTADGCEAERPDISETLHYGVGRRFQAFELEKIRHQCQRPSTVIMVESTNDGTCSQASVEFLTNLLTVAGWVSVSVVDEPLASSQIDGAVASAAARRPPPPRLRYLPNVDMRKFLVAMTSPPLQRARGSTAGPGPPGAPDNSDFGERA
ncbi:hypothetical protein EVAR_21448_1 [Eumeta japonica]|uniref:Uncharacterized protein n=1 Tax=Eumeta variegata TaxID=151549 RepID=A0A4C1VHS6_EUMVA|nr:hypothetical protein EVAR_21448_1 [Eumeta japonica]